MKLFALIAVAGLVCASPVMGLSLRGRTLVGLPTGSALYTPDSDSNDHNGFNKLASHTFDFEAEQQIIAETNVAAPATNFTHSACSFAHGTAASPNITFQECDIDGATQGIVDELKCDHGALAADAAGQYLQVCQNDAHDFNPTETTYSGFSSKVMEDLDSACISALCVPYAAGDFKIAKPAGDAHHVCDEIGDQDFLTILDCAYLNAADGSERTTNWASPLYTLDNAITANSLHNLVDADQCTLGKDGNNETDALEQAIYDLHFTLQEEVLLKVWEHARSQCKEIQDNRDMDFQQYSDALDAAKAAQDQLAKELHLYADFHNEVGSAISERSYNIGIFMNAIQDEEDALEEAKLSAQNQLANEIEAMITDAKGTAETYRNDLAKFYDNLATKKAAVADRFENLKESNDQVREHNEDIEDLDISLSFLLNQIKSALSNVDGHMDNIKTETETVMGQGVAPRSMTRDDTAATNPEATVKCANGKLVLASLKESDNTTPCACDSSEDACFTGPVSSASPVREICSDSTDYTNGGNLVKVCNDDPEPDVILERTFTTTTDESEIVSYADANGGAVATRDDAEYHDASGEPYDIYADSSTEHDTDNSDVYNENGADTTDAADGENTVFAPGQCGLCVGYVNSNGDTAVDTSGDTSGDASGDASGVCADGELLKNDGSCTDASNILIQSYWQVDTSTYEIVIGHVNDFPGDISVVAEAGSEAAGDMDSGISISSDGTIMLRRNGQPNPNVGQNIEYYFSLKQDYQGIEYTTNTDSHTVVVNGVP